MSSQIFYLPNASISLSGPDTLDFLHRLSTNDVKNSSFIKPLNTTFLNEKGKIVDHVTIFKEDNGFYLISSFDTPDILYNWLNHYHFLEDLKIEIAHKKPVMLIKDDEYHLLLSKPKEENLISINEEEWEIFRIAHQIPKGDHEITPEFRPEEVGLEDFIDDNKGCYIGQEVIAKALTYQKRKRYLKGFIFKKEELKNLKIGQKVIVGDEEAIITSISPKYIKEKINILAVVRKIS